MVFGARMGTWIILLAIIVMTSANLNLFASLAEVKKLFGLPSELYYVREGVVNTYAMQFNVLVPSHINELHFVWQNLRQQPMSYSIGFTVSNSEALGRPQMNITRKGVVPSRLSVFRIFLPCSGQMTAEVEMKIQMNFSISANNVTVLNFKRKKVCLKDDFQPQNDSVVDDPSVYAAASTKIFYIVVGCSCSLIFFIATVFGFCYIKSNKARRNETLPDHRSSSTLCNQAHTFLRVETPTNATCSGTKPSYSSFRRVAPGQLINGFQSMELVDQLAEISIGRNKVSLKEILHEGTFGRIYNGILIDDIDMRTSQSVYVKTVSDQASQIQISLLVAEGMMMYGLSHRNIQSILAVSLEDRKQPLLIYPRAALGNLKRFLQKCKFSPEGHAHVISTREVVDMAIQITLGMQYLHRRKVIHRDLATRNCVLLLFRIDERLQVRIADNALARDLFPNDYHCLGDNENRPIKWLALECLISKQFYPASDVWAFGVTLWELMTLGQQPYIEIDPFEVVAFLKDGYRLSQPINCPDELDELIPPQLFGNQPRTRRFSASFSPNNCCTSPQSPMPFRISQIKHEEGMDIVNREVAHEREVRSAMQMSQSYEDLTLVETFPLESKRNGSELFASPVSAGCSLSPTRGRKLTFSPTLQQPSPTRRIFTSKRSISPITLRPSAFSAKRKCELDEKDNVFSPNKRFHSLTPDRGLSVHPLTHSLSSNSLDDTASPEQTVPHSTTVGTPESLHSNDSMCSIFKSTDQDMQLSEPPTPDTMNQHTELVIVVKNAGIGCELALVNMDAVVNINMGLLVVRIKRVKQETSKILGMKKKTRRRSKTRIHKPEPESKIKSTVVVTRPTDKERDDDDNKGKKWSNDKSHLDFQEELDLEKRRQQLQRELALEMQKERMAQEREKVIIQKTVSSSSSSSDSSSSSRSSSSSSSSDDNRVNSSSSDDSTDSNAKHKNKRERLKSGARRFVPPPKEEQTDKSGSAKKIKDKSEHPTSNKPKSQSRRASRSPITTSPKSKGPRTPSPPPKHRHKSPDTADKERSATGKSNDKYNRKKRSSSLANDDARKTTKRWSKSPPTPELRRSPTPAARDGGSGRKSRRGNRTPSPSSLRKTKKKSLTPDKNRKPVVNEKVEKKRTSVSKEKDVPAPREARSVRSYSPDRDRDRDQDRHHHARRSLSPREDVKKMEGFRDEKDKKRRLPLREGFYKKGRDRREPNKTRGNKNQDRREPHNLPPRERELGEADRKRNVDDASRRSSPFRRGAGSPTRHPASVEERDGIKRRQDRDRDEKPGSGNHREERRDDNSRNKRPHGEKEALEDERKGYQRDKAKQDGAQDSWEWNRGQGHNKSAHDGRRSTSREKRGDDVHRDHRRGFDERGLKDDVRREREERERERDLPAGNQVLPRGERRPKERLRDNLDKLEGGRRRMNLGKGPQMGGKEGLGGEKGGRRRWRSNRDGRRGRGKNRTARRLRADNPNLQPLNKEPQWKRRDEPLEPRKRPRGGGDRLSPPAKHGRNDPSPSLRAAAWTEMPIEEQRDPPHRERESQDWNAERKRNRENDKQEDEPPKDEGYRRREPRKRRRSRSRDDKRDEKRPRRDPSKEPSQPKANEEPPPKLEEGVVNEIKGGHEPVAASVDKEVDGLSDWSDDADEILNMEEEMEVKDSLVIEEEKECVEVKPERKNLLELIEESRGKKRSSSQEKEGRSRTRERQSYRSQPTSRNTSIERRSTEKCGLLKDLMTLFNKCFCFFRVSSSASRNRSIDRNAAPPPPKEEEILLLSDASVNKLEGSKEKESENILENDDYEAISDDDLETMIEEPEDEAAKLEREAKNGTVDSLEVDWSCLTARPKAKNEAAPGSALRRFSAVYLFSRIGILPQYGGKQLLDKIKAKCEEQLREEEEEERGNQTTGSEVENSSKLQLTFESSYSNSMLFAKIKDSEQKNSVLTDIGPYRRALCARRDLQLRKQLYKVTEKIPSVTPQSFDNEMYKLSVQLFKQRKIEQEKAIHIENPSTYLMVKTMNCSTTVHDDKQTEAKTNHIDIEAENLSAAGETASETNDANANGHQDPLIEEGTTTSRSSCRTSMPVTKDPRLDTNSAPFTIPAVFETCQNGNGWITTNAFNSHFHPQMPMTPGVPYAAKCAGPHRGQSPSRYSPSPHQSRGTSPNEATNTGAPPPPPPLPTSQHVVHLHVNPGEAISFQVGDQMQLIQGPATVRMVSNNTSPPIPMPVHVPPGHMVQQIVDENGTLRHVILSPQPPMSVPMGPTPYPPGPGPNTGPTSPHFYAYPHPYPHPPHPQYHPHPAGPPPPAHIQAQGVTQAMHGQVPPLSSHPCNSHHSQGPSPPPPIPQHKDERTQRQYMKMRKKLEARQKENSTTNISFSCNTHLTVPPPSSFPKKDNASKKYKDGNSSTTGSEENDETNKEQEEESKVLIELLSKVFPPKVSEVDARSAFLRWKPPDMSSEDENKKNDLSIRESDFTYDVLLSDHGKDSKYRVIYSGSALEYKLTDLKPATEYHVCLEAVMDELRGKISEAVVFKTKCCEPDIPGPPKVVNRTKTSLTLRWNPSADNGSKVINYILEYDEGRGDGKFVELLRTSSKQPKISKLNASTCYKFRVSAVNEIGRSKTSESYACMTSGSPPSQPIPPQLKEAHVTRLLVSWQKRPTDDEFTLQMEDEDSGHGFLPVYNGKETLCMCSNLLRNTEYKFRLCAINDEGASRWSDSVTYRTRPDRPGIPGKPVPKDLILLKIDPPKDNGGSDIQSYTLEIDSGNNFEPIYTGNETEYVCDHLLAGRTYRFRVRASSQGGLSEYSEVFAASTLAVCPGRCSVPRLHGKPKATTLNLKWNYPEDDGGSPITEFEIEMTNPDNTSRQVYRGRDLDCMIASLLPGRPYLFQVRAYNKVGFGPLSEPLEVVSGAGPPDRPCEPRVTFKSPHTATVSWDEPVNNGAAVTEFRLEWSTKDGEFQQLFQGYALNYEIKNLSPATQYNFRLRVMILVHIFMRNIKIKLCLMQAVNSAGSSALSEATSCATPASSPGAISTSSIKYTCTATSIDLTWREPASNGSNILSYNVDLSERHLLITEGDTPKCLIDNLTPETTYKIRIQAVSSVGVGPFSSLLKICTLSLPPAPPRLECMRIGHNSLVIKWGEGKNADFTHYTLEMENRAGNFVPVYQGGSLSQKISKLMETTEYRFRICAANDAGSGPYSDVVGFTTCKAPPPVPKPPRVTEVSETSCLVEWQQAKPVGDDVIIYQLQLLNLREQEFRLVYKGSELNKRLTGLEPKTEYNVRVGAIRQCRQESDSESAQVVEVAGAFSSSTTFVTPSLERLRIAQTKSHSAQTVERKPLTDQQWAVIDNIQDGRTLKRTQCKVFGRTCELTSCGVRVAKDFAGTDQDYQRHWPGLPAALARTSSGIGQDFQRHWPGLPAALARTSSGIGQDFQRHWPGLPAALARTSPARTRT
uniref:receptor protein-tyrosine kinase n=1 Tax=Strigamia maritima TaxID=126957 RepID=T1IZQ5_STRMM